MTEVEALLEERAEWLACQRENYGLDHYISLLADALKAAYRDGLALSAPSTPASQELEIRPVGEGTAGEDNRGVIIGRGYTRFTPASPPQETKTTKS